LLPQGWSLSFPLVQKRPVTSGHAHTPFDVFSIGRRCGWRKRLLLFKNRDRFRLCNLTYPRYLCSPNRNVRGDRGRPAIHCYYGVLVLAGCGKRFAGGRPPPERANVVSALPELYPASGISSSALLGGGVRVWQRAMLPALFTHQSVAYRW